MPQLDPTWFSSQLFWLVVSFITLYVLMARFALPPLLGIIEKRKEAVAADIEQAQRSKSEAEIARQKYERALGESRGQAQQLMNDVMLAHKQRSEQAGKDMDAQVTAKLTEAEKAIAAKKEQLKSSLEPTASELAGMIVEKLTSRAADSAKIGAALNQASKARG